MGKRKSLFSPKKAKEVKAKRKAESSEETEKRLTQSKEYKKLLRDNETPEAKAARLEKERIATASSRSKETPEAKCTRLEKKRIATASSRSKETPEAKCARQEKDRVSAYKSRKLKFLDERDIILNSYRSDALDNTNPHASSTDAQVSSPSALVVNSIAHSSASLSITVDGANSNASTSSTTHVSSYSLGFHVTSTSTVSSISLSSASLSTTATSVLNGTNSNASASSTTHVSSSSLGSHVTSTSTISSISLSSASLSTTATSVLNGTNSNASASSTTHVSSSSLGSHVTSTSTVSSIALSSASLSTTATSVLNGTNSNASASSTTHVSSSSLGSHVTSTSTVSSITLSSASLSTTATSVLNGTNSNASASSTTHVSSSNLGSHVLMSSTAHVSILNANVSSNSVSSANNNTVQHFIGQMCKVCPHCSALRFPDENLNCCHSGKVQLTTDAYPDELKSLFTVPEFLKNIRIYNSIFAFASLGAQMAPPPGFGPYCFRIHGQLYHRSGSLHPQDGQSRQYGQVYILDGAEALELRVRRAPDLSRVTVSKIQTYLNSSNPYAKLYKHMSEVEYAENMRAVAAGESPNVVRMIFREGADSRRYNAPTNEIAAVFVGDDGAPPGNHDIIVHPKGQPLQNISYLNKHCDALLYPLLFPTGQFGWDPSGRHNSQFATAVRDRVTQLQYYSYRLAYRSNDFSAIHKSGKLFQQYMVDAYVKTEAQRLAFYATHQEKLRVDSYKGLMDHIYGQASVHNAAVGRIVVLPSSFQGSPRNMQQEYQDAMTIVSKMGKPDLFLTMTCNPKWREVQENLLSGQSASDRPDLVSRVFRLKLKELQKDIVDREILGTIAAKIHVIEFQKRGLPHAHLLLWLSNNHKLRTEDDIDNLISAEIPDPTTQPTLYKIIKETMMHGPCGIVDGKVFDKTPCQCSGKCSKNFPKQYSDSTVICVDGYPVYRRRNNGRFVEVRGCKLDNKWVVPYCPMLSLKYGCHINLEACMSIKSVKYLFKYVYKGHDCINLELSESNVYNHDEIKMYLDARYVSAPEAFWRLSEYELHEKSHTIYRLPVHLPDLQNVYFQSGREEEALDRSTITRLTAWFILNREDPRARQYLYSEIPHEFVYIGKQKKWVKRKRGGDKVIGRMYTASPLDREKFALRCLLLHVKGAPCYADLRNYNNIQYGTFQEACIARGLLEDDQEWDRALSDAVALLMPRQCRQLFVTILTHCQPSEPHVLWERYKSSLSEDFARHQSSDVAIQRALAEIEQRLSEFGMSCVDRGLPAPNLGIIAAADIDPVDDAAIAARNMAILNADQAEIVNEIFDKAVNGDNTRPNLHYLDGPAGTGKTMVYNTLISLLKSRGIPVASCAWTGIASILLRGGVTVRNLFKLPVPILDTSSCRISPSSPYADFIRSLSLILIDEASMIPNDATHAIDRALRDIMENNIPFGGKLILFGGDFRQVLPVVVRGTATKILEKCLKRSHLWHLFKVHTLSKNMRALPEEREFSKWLLKLGNGTLKSSSVTDAEMIDVPVECLAGDLVDELFPDFSVDRQMSVILTPKNDTSLKLNDEILERLPGTQVEFLSCDKALCDDEEEAQNYPLEFLNSITPTGMPPHKLILKEGCTVMLLRNLSSKRGLCNGVRLEVIRIYNAVIHCKILTGSHVGQEVLIPKLKLAPSDANLPFVLQRIQFPLRLSYSMTINKSQGQTFDHVGIFLEEPVFSHGQLYVAFSRARTLNGVKAKVGKSSNGKEQATRNVVYRDIL